MEYIEDIEVAAEKKKRMTQFCAYAHTRHPQDKTEGGPGRIGWRVSYARVRRRAAGKGCLVSRGFVSIGAGLWQSPSEDFREFLVI